MAKRFNFTPPEIKEHFTRDILEENIKSAIEYQGNIEQEDQEFILSQIPFPDKLLVAVAHLKYQAMAQYSDYRSEDEVDELGNHIMQTACNHFNIKHKF